MTSLAHHWQTRESAPLPYGSVFTKADEATDYFTVKQLQDEFGFEYPVVVGCLLWLLNTFPRLQFGVQKLENTFDP